MAEPHRVRVDQLLRPVLPNRARSPPQARQRLPEALGWEEIQTAADPQALQPVAGPDCSRDSPACSPTGAWPARISADQKSPVTGDCHAGICGSPGAAMPPATRLRPLRESRTGGSDARQLSHCQHAALSVCFRIARRAGPVMDGPCGHAMRRPVTEPQRTASRAARGSGIRSTGAGTIRYIDRLRTRSSKRSRGTDACAANVLIA